MNTTKVIDAALSAAQSIKTGDISAIVSLFPVTVEDEQLMLELLEAQLGEVPPVAVDGLVWRLWECDHATLFLHAAKDRRVPEWSEYSYGQAEVYRDGRLHVAIYQGDRHICEVEGVSWREVHERAAYALDFLEQEEATR